MAAAAAVAVSPSSLSILGRHAASTGYDGNFEGESSVITAGHSGSDGGCGEGVLGDAEGNDVFEGCARAEDQFKPGRRTSLAAQSLGTSEATAPSSQTTAAAAATQDAVGSGPSADGSSGLGAGAPTDACGFKEPSSLTAAAQSIGLPLSPRKAAAAAAAAAAVAQGCLASAGGRRSPMLLLHPKPRVAAEAAEARALPSQDAEVTADEGTATPDSEAAHDQAHPASQDSLANLTATAPRSHLDLTRHALPHCCVTNAMPSSRRWTSSVRKWHAVPLSQGASPPRPRPYIFPALAATPWRRSLRPPRPSCRSTTSCASPSSSSRRNSGCSNLARWPGRRRRSTLTPGLHLAASNALWNTGRHGELRRKA